MKKEFLSSNGLKWFFFIFDIHNNHNIKRLNNLLSNIEFQEPIIWCLLVLSKDGIKFFF